jgi:hypothetical protein
MLLAGIVVLLAGLTLFTFAAYCCVGLRKSAQAREDAKDQRIWDYLLDPRTL